MQTGHSAGEVGSSGEVDVEERSSWGCVEHSAGEVGSADEVD